MHQTILSRSENSRSGWGWLGESQGLCLSFIVRPRLHYKLEKWNVTSEFLQMESRRWLTGLDNGLFVYNDQLVSTEALTIEQNFS